MPADTPDHTAATGDGPRRLTDGSPDLPRPPLAFTDATDRDVEIRAAETVPGSLVEMYDGYEDADRAQGLPPRDETRIREWLDGVFADGCDVVAWHGDCAVGHATLVPMGEGTAELAVFVAGDYQNAGIGSRLLRTLLGRGRADGVERVWLTVSRDNPPAVSLYRGADFETTRRGLELEMERPL